MCVHVHVYARVCMCVYVCAECVHALSACMYIYILVHVYTSQRVLLEALFTQTKYGCKKPTRKSTTKSSNGL